jgi:putative aminopeptidase FrvX
MTGKFHHRILLGLLLILPAAALAQSAKFNRLPQDVIENRLQQYKGRDSTRAVTIEKLFQDAGCGGEYLSEQKVPHTSAPNIICTLPGARNSVILVGAHFDHVPAGDGVVDNWSGASLLPSLYQSLSSMPRQHTFVFISFTDEEKGMIGSKFYADHLTNNEITIVDAMIDIDTLGLGPTEVWNSNSDQTLVKQLVGTASAMKLPVRGMNVDGVGDSDGSSFKRHNIPIITLHSVTKETFRILHTYKDRLSAIKLDDYYDSYKLIAGYLAVLDSESGK